LVVVRRGSALVSAAACGHLPVSASWPVRPPINREAPPATGGSIGANEAVVNGKRREKAAVSGKFRGRLLGSGAAAKTSGFSVISVLRDTGFGDFAQRAKARHDDDPQTWVGRPDLPQHRDSAQGGDLRRELRRDVGVQRFAHA